MTNERKSKYQSPNPEARKRQLANLRPDASVTHGGFAKLDHFSDSDKELFAAMFDYYKDFYSLEAPADIDMLAIAIKSFIKGERQDLYEEQTGKAISAHATDHRDKFVKYIQALGLDRRFNKRAETASKFDLALFIAAQEHPDLQFNDNEE